MGRERNLGKLLEIVYYWKKKLFTSERSICIPRVDPRFPTSAVAPFLKSFHARLFRLEFAPEISLEDKEPNPISAKKNSKMKIVPVACLEDNYAYLIVDESTKKAAAVDPVEPEKVLTAASEVGAYVDCVLTTHHHWDHAGGNEKMRLLVPEIKVYGGSLDNVKGCTDQVENGTKLSLGKDIEILCLHTPCHTKGHISYYVTSKDEEDPAVFTGDTLFIAGCGRFFEGTAEQMYQSLCVTLGSLPKPTRVYCGHEYTVKSLQFMLTVEPENEKMKQKLEWAQKQREANQPTVPSTIGDEFEINTFMRVDLPEIQAKFGAKSPVEALREVRKIKDNWKG